VINHFGDEWARFNFENGMAQDFTIKQSEMYVKSLDLNIFDAKSSVAGDFGAGSGRWTENFYHLSTK
jgi:hypothetical protein